MNVKVSKVFNETVSLEDTVIGLHTLQLQLVIFGEGVSQVLANCSFSSWGRGILGYSNLSSSGQLFIFKGDGHSWLLKTQSPNSRPTFHWGGSILGQPRIGIIVKGLNFEITFVNNTSSSTTCFKYCISLDFRPSIMEFPTRHLALCNRVYPSGCSQFKQVGTRSNQLDLVPVHMI